MLQTTTATMQNRSHLTDTILQQNLVRNYKKEDGDNSLLSNRYFRGFEFKQIFTTKKNCCEVNQSFFKEWKF